MQHICRHNCAIVVVSGKNVRRRIANPTMMAFSVESESAIDWQDWPNVESAK